MGAKSILAECTKSKVSMLSTISSGAAQRRKRIVSAWRSGMFTRATVLSPVNGDTRALNIDRLTRRALATDQNVAQDSTQQATRRRTLWFPVLRSLPTYLALDNSPTAMANSDTTQGNPFILDNTERPLVDACEFCRALCEHKKNMKEEADCLELCKRGVLI